MKVVVKTSDQTIKRIMRSFKYHKFLVYQKSWQSSQSATNQVKYAQKKLIKYL